MKHCLETVFILVDVGAKMRLFFVRFDF